jgi:hypothetical protein
MSPLSSRHTVNFADKKSTNLVKYPNTSLLYIKDGLVRTSQTLHGSSFATIIFRTGGLCPYRVYTYGYPTRTAKKSSYYTSFDQTVEHEVLHVIISIVCPINLNKHSTPP